jgi:hypothetical protein
MSGPPHTDPASWLAANAARGSTSDIRLATGIHLYTWWNVWKERSKCIFDSSMRSEFQVVCAAKEEIASFRRDMQDFRPP